MRQLTGHRSGHPLQVIAMVTACLIFLIALLAPLVANERPLYCYFRGAHLFPAFSGKAVYNGEDKDGTWQLEVAATDWKRLDMGRVLWPLVPYGPNTTDYHNAFLNGNYKSPGDKQVVMTPSGQVRSIPLAFRHWLGTGRLGEDILSSMIYGTRTAVFIGLLSMLFAALPGILLGLLGGYFGDGRLRMRIEWLLGLVPGLMLGWYYSHLTGWIFEEASHSTIVALGRSLVFLLVTTMVMGLFRLGGGLMGSRRMVKVPVDAIIEKVLFLFYSIPRIVLLIIMASFFTRIGMAVMVFIIAAATWPGITRLVRGEVLRIRETGFVDAVHALGYGPVRILFVHVLPVAAGPALVALAYGVGSAVMLEAALSFLGIPLDETVVSWGQLIAEGKDHIQAWWIIFFPSVAIFFMVSLCHYAAERISTFRLAA